MQGATRGPACPSHGWRASGAPRGGEHPDRTALLSAVPCTTAPRGWHRARGRCHRHPPVGDHRAPVAQPGWGRSPGAGGVGWGGRMRPSPTPRGAGARARRAGSWARRQAEAMGAVPGVAWGSRAGPGSGTRPVQTGRASQTSSDRQRAPAKSTPRRGQAAGMRMLGQPGGGPWVGTAQQHRGASFCLAWGAPGGPQGARTLHPSPRREPGRKQGGEGSTQAAPGTGDKAPCRTSSEPGRAGCGPCGQLGHCHTAGRSPCHPASPRGCGAAATGLAGTDGGVPGVLQTPQPSAWPTGDRRTG